MERNVGPGGWRCGVWMLFNRTRGSLARVPGVTCVMRSRRFSTATTHQQQAHRTVDELVDEWERYRAVGGSGTATEVAKRLLCLVEQGVSVRWVSDHTDTGALCMCVIGDRYSTASAAGGHVGAYQGSQGANVCH